MFMDEWKPCQENLNVMDEKIQGKLWSAWIITIAL
jgi:hypothetical protein